jgi:hypothetical protein
MAANDFELDEFEIDEGDDQYASKVNRFQAQVRKYRVSIAWWPGFSEGKPDLDAKSPKFGGGKRYYIEGVGSVLYKHGFKEIVGEDPKRAIVTIAVVWPTDEEGTVQKEALRAGKFQVLPWVLSQQKYRDITTKHREWPMGSHDLLVDCEDSQYQKMTFSPLRESLLRKFRDSDKEDVQGFYQRILAEVKDAVPTLSESIGQDLSADKLREKMGKASAPGASPAAGASDDDVDGMLDDLLDS